MKLGLGALLNTTTSSHPLLLSHYLFIFNYICFCLVTFLSISWAFYLWWWIQCTKFLKLHLVHTLYLWIVLPGSRQKHISYALLDSVCMMFDIFQVGIFGGLLCLWYGLIVCGSLMNKLKQTLTCLVAAWLELIFETDSLNSKICVNHSVIGCNVK